MINKQRTILVFLSIYVVSIGALTIYHALNFQHYVHRKGDETTHYTWLLLATSILFQAIAWVTIKQFDWKAALLGTVVNFVLSYVVGFAVLMISGLSGISKHLILIYGGCYITFFIIVTVLQSFRMRE